MVFAVITAISNVYASEALKQNDVAPTLDIGFIWDSPDQYSDALRDRNTRKLTLRFRPSIEF